MSNNLLSKENSLVLRGMAIMVIMLHNFLHNPQLGFSLENEMSFSQERASFFFNILYSGKLNAYELFSFLGWTGVAIFVFLTGYGVSSLSNECRYTKCQILKRRYIKLLLLLFPAMLVFVVGDIIEHNLFPAIIKRFLYLTMMVNVVYPWFRCHPGVYWYFSLTFQFYLIYALFAKYLHERNLIIISVLTIIGLGILSSLDCPELLSVYRHCFTGWFIVFAIGVWLGKQKSSIISTEHWILMDVIVFLMAAVLVILMNRYMMTWLLIPVVALVMYLALGLMMMRSSVLMKLFTWIGKLSAAIFVCHPISRLVINRLMLPRVDNILFVVLVYIVVTLIIAMMYDRLYKKLISIVI